MFSCISYTLPLHIHAIDSPGRENIIGKTFLHAATSIGFPTAVSRTTVPIGSNSLTNNAYFNSVVIAHDC